MLSSVVGAKAKAPFNPLLQMRKKKPDQTVGLQSRMNQTAPAQGGEAGDGACHLHT